MTSAATSRPSTIYRYDGVGREPALNLYLDRFLTYVETATASAARFVDAAVDIHGQWRAAVAGVRSDSSLHTAVDLVVEHPVISAPFLAERLGVSGVSAQKLVRKLVAANILAPAKGKYRRSALYQADDILALLAYGSEARTRAPEPGRPRRQDDDSSGRRWCTDAGIPRPRGLARTGYRSRDSGAGATATSSGAPDHLVERAP